MKSNRVQNGQLMLREFIRCLVTQCIRSALFRPKLEKTLIQPAEPLQQLLNAGKLWKLLGPYYSRLVCIIIIDTCTAPAAGCFLVQYASLAPEGAAREGREGAGHVNRAKDGAKSNLKWPVVNDLVCMKVLPPNGEGR